MIQDSSLGTCDMLVYFINDRGFKLAGEGTVHIKHLPEVLRYFSQFLDGHNAFYKPHKCDTMTQLGQRTDED